MPFATLWRLLGCILQMMSLIDLNHLLTLIIKEVLGKCVILKIVKFIENIKKSYKKTNIN